MIVRAYNSKASAGWSFGLGGYPYQVLNPSGGANAPVFRTVDGARHQSYLEATNTYRTKQFWNYRSDLRRLELTDGTRCHYSTNGSLTSVVDTFGNTITLTYSPTGGELQSLTQSLGSGQTRVVTFGSGALPGKLPPSMTYLTHTWGYHQNSQANFLSEFDPPAGSNWVFSYHEVQTTVLASVTTDHGGVVQYAFGTESFSTPSGWVSTRVLQNRYTHTNITDAGTWSFDYFPAQGGGMTVWGPLNTKTDFIYSTPAGGSEPALERVERFENVSTSVERDTRGYQVQGVTSSGGGTVNLPKTRTIHRNGANYTTTLSYHAANFADFGRPHKIEEAGHLQRETNFVFTYEFDPNRWIKDKVQSETLVQSAQSFTISRTYSFNTGFMESETRYGVMTSFSPDVLGNVGTVTDAHQHVTTRTYERGVEKTVVTPEYAISRAIYPNGTVQSETRPASRRRSTTTPWGGGRWWSRQTGIRQSPSTSPTRFGAPAVTRA